MSYKYLSIMVWLLALALGWGCREALLQDEPPADAEAVFDHAWRELDERYCYFELKGVKWDSLRSVYRPRAATASTNYELFRVLADLIGELRDGHSNVYSPIDRSTYQGWATNYPQNYDEGLLERSYGLDTAFYANGIRHMWIGDVGYCWYESFSGSVTDGTLNRIFSRYANAKGLIFDIRANGGGNANYPPRILKRMFRERRQVLETRYKTGPGHDDFSDWDAAFLAPNTDDDKLNWHGPFIILTGRRCYSAATTYAGMAKASPHIIVLGDTNGGGGGAPAAFELPNAWTIRYSARPMRLPDGRDLELGVPPDTVVAFDEMKALDGEDTILEAALEHIRDN